MAVNISRLRKLVLDKWTKLYNSKLVTLNKYIKKEQHELKEHNLRTKYIQNFNKLIKANNISGIYIAGDKKPNYSPYIATHKYDINKINKILDLIKTSNLEELQDINHMFYIKHVILTTCYMPKNFRDKKIEKIHNTQINIVTGCNPYMSVCIKIKNRTFSVHKSYPYKHFILKELMTSNYGAPIFNKCSDEKKSKLILKCFKIEPKQNDVNKLLKDLAKTKSPKAYNTLAKMIIFT
jgi:hypothetical protein